MAKLDRWTPYSEFLPPKDKPSEWEEIKRVESPDGRSVQITLQKRVRGEGLEPPAFSTRESGRSTS
jgi:hypothetical protein